MYITVHLLYYITIAPCSPVRAPVHCYIIFVYLLDIYFFLNSRSHVSPDFYPWARSFYIIPWYIVFIYLCIYIFCSRLVSCLFTLELRPIKSSCGVDGDGVNYNVISPSCV